jgi:hypothetical protein
MTFVFSNEAVDIFECAPRIFRFFRKIYICKTDYVTSNEIAAYISYPSVHNCHDYRVEKERFFCDVLAEAEEIVEHRACNTRYYNYITLLR